MNKSYAAVFVLVVAILGFLLLRPETITNLEDVENGLLFSEMEINITPISHASVIINWGGTIIYVDPVGKSDLYKAHANPDLILITDIHGDHLSMETLEGVMEEKTTIVAPSAVTDELTDKLKTNIIILANGETKQFVDKSIEAIPMYNIPESPDAFHVKGRGNGYVVDDGSNRIYIAGDTSGIPEMRELRDIDIAFIPMNLPFTMAVEDAADAVLDFKPKQVIPYHYRGRENLSDVNKFKELVNASDTNIEVILMNWYPEI